MIGGAVLKPRLSLVATISPNFWPATMARLRWTRKRGTTKPLRLISRRWRNTRASARRFSTGSTPTKKSKSTLIKTSQIPITRSSSTTRTTPTRDLLCPKSQSSRTCISPASCRNRASFFLSVVVRSRLVTRLLVFFELLLH